MSRRTLSENEDAPSLRPRKQQRASEPSLPPNAWANCLMDLLVLIISSLPSRARLWVISHVCKRWRIAALRTITSACLARSSSKVPLSSFPMLTDLRLAWTVILYTSQVPATVTALHIQCVENYRAPIKLPPRLYSLSFTNVGVFDDTVARIVRAAASTLTKLSLSGVASWDTDLEVVLPQLQSLTFALPSEGKNSARRFLESCSLLTSLDVNYSSRSGNQVPHRASLPELRRLAVRGHISNVGFRTLLEHYSTVSSLTIETFYNSFDLLEHDMHITTLTELTVPYPLDIQAFAALEIANKRNPNLRKIVPLFSRSANVIPFFFLAPPVRLLTSITISQADRSNLETLLANCTVLHALKMTNLQFSVVHPFPFVTSPYLQEIACMGKQWSFVEMISFWQTVLLRINSLRTITAACIDARTAKSEASFFALLALFISKGVTHISWPMAGFSASEALRNARLWLQLGPFGRF